MKTINLLPKNRQEELFYANILYVLYRVIFVSFLCFFAVLFSQLATKVYLSRQAEDLKSQIELLKQKAGDRDITVLKQKILEVNQNISDYKTLATTLPKWSKVIARFSQMPPEGLLVNSMAIDVNRKTITITGFSPTRELVIELFEKIKADKEYFMDINYPFENVAKATEVSFHFTFSVKEEALK